VDQVLAPREGTRLLVLGPLVKDRKTEGDRVFEAARRQGFVRVRVDGVQYDLAEAPTLDKYKRHTIEVVVDRYVVRRAEAPDDWTRDQLGRPIDPATDAPLPDPDASRLADSIETALRLGEGVVGIAPVPREGEAPAFDERRYSERYSCPYDGTMIDDLEPRSFSFNSPHGACPTCTGLGTQLVIDPEASERDQAIVQSQRAVLGCDRYGQAGKPMWLDPRQAAEPLGLWDLDREAAVPSQLLAVHHVLNCVSAGAAAAGPDAIGALVQYAGCRADVAQLDEKKLRAELERGGFNEQARITAVLTLAQARYRASLLEQALAAKAKADPDLKAALIDAPE
ncbi:MAG TPA: hypothetical protein PKA98_23730, partial [Acidimicrobiales bacterium]|nr:hypothetical protein [Acidimicrobiales bacterium]